MNRFKAAVAAVALACLGIACVPGFEGSGIDSGDGAARKTKKASSCGPKLEAQDPAKLPKCACEDGGKARCVAKSKVPASFAAQLGECDDGVCIPDKLVKSGGAAPTTCKSAFGEGRCMSLCIPEVAGKASLLNRGEGDVCSSDERCVPCVDPTKGTETGVCDIGKASGESCEEEDTDETPAPTGGACPYEGPPLVDVNNFPSCGDGARCVPSNLVPAESAGRLKACSGGLCAPEKSIAAGGNFLPKTCASVSGAEGRCLNVNLPDVEAQASVLPQDTCDASERCVPCFSPASGAETGACRSVSCDAPKQPAKPLAACCGGRAKCVPKALVPASSQKSLSSGGCSGGELCAPNEQLDPNNRPVACQGQGLTGAYNGFCVSTCIERDFFEEMGTSQGSCGGGFFCAPCLKPSVTDLLFGFPPSEPTGVPGCNN